MMNYLQGVQDRGLNNLISFVLVIVYVDFGLMKATPSTSSTVFTVTRASSAYHADTVRMDPFIKNSCSNLNAESIAATDECRCKWHNGVASTFMSDFGKCENYRFIKNVYPFLYKSGSNLIPLNLSISPYQSYPVHYYKVTNHGTIQAFQQCFQLADQMYLEGGMWKPTKFRHFFLVKDVPETFCLKWATDDSVNYDYLQGKLVKLNISCHASNEVMNGNMILKILGSYSYSDSQIPTSSPTFLPGHITPTTKPGGGGGSKDNDSNSTVLIAVISSVAVIIFITVISMSVCFIVRKKRSVPVDNPEYLAAGPDSEIVQNNVSRQVNMRNPTYQDFKETPVYAECAGSYQQVSMVEKFGSTLGKNNNIERTPTADNDKSEIANDYCGIYQPLIKPELPQYHLLTQPEDTTTQHSTEDYSTLDTKTPQPGSETYDLLNRPMENKIEKSCPGTNSPNQTQKSNTIPPKYDTLVLQKTKQEHGNSKKPVNDPEYSVLENSKNEPEYDVLENSKSDPEYSVLENSKNEPGYNVLEHPVNDPEYEVLEKSGDKPEYDTLQKYWK